MIIAPTPDLDARFSDPGAVPTEWSEVATTFERAELFWLTTLRADGRPHVTPLLAVWLDGAMHFCTGPGEQKAKNLEHHDACILTTGSNSLHDGLDVVVEGRAVVMADETRLRALAARYESKYGPDWHFDVRDGAFHGQGDRAVVFEVVPDKVLAFRKGPYSQTRYRFGGTS